MSNSLDITGQDSSAWIQFSSHNLEPISVGSSCSRLAFMKQNNNLIAVFTFSCFSNNDPLPRG
jgi:hypothetical protein